MNVNNLLGEKIKKRRKELAITQSALAAGKITRNMLSLIENGAAMPSYDTALYLAEALDLPLPYLFSDDLNLFFYEKSERIDNIKKLFTEKKYTACMTALDALSGHDDETDFIYAKSAFEQGKRFVFQGSLISASKYFTISQDKCKSTVYDTSDIECFIPLYEAIITNIGAPLLEFDEEHFLESYKTSADFEFYKYIVQDSAYQFENKVYAKHLAAKAYLKQRDYYAAIPLLLEIEETKSSKDSNATVLFGVYTDLQLAYKQVGNFESAYRYSSKLISLMNGFKI